jgi:hypothetical protein
MVIILNKAPLVDYHGNVEPEFGPGDQDSLIIDFFKQQLIKDIKSLTSINTIQFDTCTTTGSYDSFEIETIGNTAKIPVLGKGGHYSCQNSDPTFILTLSDVNIGTEYQNYTTMNFNGMMMGGSASKKLYYKAQVTLFDNRAQQIIRYGYVNESVKGKGFWPVIRINDWYDISSNFTSIIFDGFNPVQP